MTDESVTTWISEKGVGDGYLHIIIYCGQE